MRNLEVHAPRKEVKTWSQYGADYVWQYYVILPIQGISETEYQAMVTKNHYHTSELLHS
jgi:hypothetical protein